MAVQLPVGQEDSFHGVIDLVTMRCITWNEDVLGAEFQVTELPAELAEVAGIKRQELLEAVKKRKVLEKLKHREMSAYKRQEIIKEQAITNEAAAGSHRRKR